jgi:hypothetical protein
MKEHLKEELEELEGEFERDELWNEKTWICNFIMFLQVLFCFIFLLNFFYKLVVKIVFENQWFTNLCKLIWLKLDYVWNLGHFFSTWKNNYVFDEFSKMILKIRIDDFHKRWKLIYITYLSSLKTLFFPPPTYPSTYLAT